MKYSHDRQFLEAAIQKYMEDLVHHKYFGWKVCLMVSFLDYLMETLSIPYPPSIKKEIVALFNEGSTKYLQTYGNKSILKMRYFSDAIHQKKGLVYQFLQDYYKKTILPACKFFEVDKTYDVHFSKTIEQVFIFADYVNHGMVYHLNRFLSAPKRVLTGNNVEFLLKQCLELVGNH